MPSRTPTSDKDAAKARVAGLNVPDDDPEATQVLAKVDTTQPLDQRRAGNGQPPTTDLERAVDALLVADAAVLARLAEQDHFDGLVAADAAHIRALKALLHRAVQGREDDGARQLVPAEVIGQGLATFRAWAQERGVNGGGSA